jgi:hypothetical protein
VRRCCEASPCPGSCGLRGTRRHGNRRCLGSRGGRRRYGCLGLLWLSSLLGDRSLGFLCRFLADSGRDLFGLRCLNLLWNLVNGSSGSNSLVGGSGLRRLKLLIDLVKILLAACNVVVLVKGCGLGGSGGRGRLLDAIGGRRGLVLELFLLLGLLSEVAEDVVQYEVAVGLLCEDECLGETLVGLALVGNLANDLDDDVGV